MRRESLVGIPILSVWLLASGGLRVSLRSHAGFGRPLAISPRKDTLCERKAYTPTGHGHCDCGPMSGLGCVAAARSAWAQYGGRKGPPSRNLGTVTGLAHGPGGWAGLPHAGNEPHARALHIYNYVCITVALNALCELDTSILCYNSSVILYYCSITV